MAKYKIGQIVVGRKILGSFVGLNMHGAKCTMYAYRHVGESELLHPLFCSEATLVRRENYEFNAKKSV